MSVSFAPHPTSPPSPASASPSFMATSLTTRLNRETSKIELATACLYGCEVLYSSLRLVAVADESASGMKDDDGLDGFDRLAAGSDDGEDALRTGAETGDMLLSGRGWADGVWRAKREGRVVSSNLVELEAHLRPPSDAHSTDPPHYHHPRISVNHLRFGSPLRLFNTHVRSDELVLAAL